MISRLSGFITVTILCLMLAACQVEIKNTQANAPEFSVRLDAALTESGQDGRLLLLLATRDDEEPRFLVNNSADTQLVFGINVEDWRGDNEIVIDKDAIGFPLASLADVPAGTYFAQALLNRYKDYSLANGKVVSLPPDRGEGQKWNRKPGNFYSRPVQIKIDESGSGSFELVLDQIIPDIVPPDDTEYVKHIRMRSELLS
ncbi:MAG: hypothetical protein WBM61_18230, partial [Woeseiaceae bacterium]